MSTETGNSAAILVNQAQRIAVSPHLGLISVSQRLVSQHDAPYTRLVNRHAFDAVRRDRALDHGVFAEGLETLRVLP